MYVPNTSINITALISFCLYIHTTVPCEQIGCLARLRGELAIKPRKYEVLRVITICPLDQKRYFGRKKSIRPATRREMVRINA